MPQEDSFGWPDFIEELGNITDPQILKRLHIDDNFSLRLNIKDPTRRALEDRLHSYPVAGDQHDFFMDHMLFDSRYYQCGDTRINYDSGKSGMGSSVELGMRRKERGDLPPRITFHPDAGLGGHDAQILETKRAVLEIVELLMQLDIPFPSEYPIESWKYDKSDQ